MASKEETINVIFAGKDRVSATMDKISRGFNKFDAAVQSIANPLAGVADSVIKVDAALSAMVVGGLALSIRESGKFGDSFAEISTLIGETGEGVDKFRKDILDYARDSGMAIEDINRAVYSALSNGIDYKIALENLNEAEKLSVAGKADLDNTLKVLSNTMTAYGESTDQAGRYSDILFTAVERGQTTLPELSSTLSQITGIAANAGIPFETLSAAIAALTASGLPTSQAITGLKAAISNIITPSGKAAEAAKKLKVEFGAAAIESKGLEKVFWDVYKAAGGNVDKMAKLFGSVEGLNAALILGSDSSEKFKEALQAMADSAGATERAYQKMVDNFKLINQNLANNVKATLIEIGDKIIGRYKDVVGEVSEVFEAIGIAVDAGSFNPLFKALDKFGKEVQEFFDALGKSLPEALAKVKWDKFLSALRGLGDSFGNLFGDFDPEDPQKVADAIQFVVDSVESLISVTKGMVDGFKPFLEGILNSVEAFNKMSSAEKESSGELLSLAKAVVTLGTGITAGLIAIGDSAQDLGRVFQGLSGAIDVYWGGLKTGIQYLASSFLDGIEIILKVLDKITFGDFNEDVKEALASVQKWNDEIEGRMDKSANQVHRGFMKIGNAVSNAGKQVDGLKRKVSKPIEINVSAGIDPDMFIGFEDAWKEEEVKAEIAVIYKWTDADGQTHITDYPPPPDEAIGDIKEIKAPIHADVDKGALDNARKKIKKAFTKAEMGPINLGFDIGSGVGGIFDQVTSQFKDKPIPAEDLFDPSGLADLFDALDNTKSLRARAQVERAINQQLSIQRELANLQKAAAQQMFEAAYKYTSTSEQGEEKGTIEIDLKGVEPELEALMWKVLKKIQVRANESGAEFLLAAT